VFNPEFAFVEPFGFERNAMFRTWSAFPSDHAMLYSALATGLFFVSRGLGTAAHVYWLAVIGLPRLYLGYHHPTDIIAGGVAGAVVTWAFNQDKARALLTRRPLEWLQRYPAPCYAALFLFTMQLATMFSGPRGFAGTAVKLAKLSRRS
jgi:undecaprenyl-diphosphatase